MGDKKVDRRVRKTKQQLLKALLELLKQKNINEISVRELAELADINRGTFYLHYKDPYDMLKSVSQELMENFRAILDAHKPRGKTEDLTALFTQVFTFVADNRELSFLLLGEHGDPGFVTSMKAIVHDKCLRDWMELYRNKNGSLFEYLYSYMVSGVMALILQWLSSGARESPEEMARLTDTIFSQGIQVLMN